jgi:sarcosine oxidase subunit alpha
MSVAGPKSRQVLGKAFSGTDFSDAALPIMGVMSIKTASGTILVARLSFSGELAYEVFCPACMGTEIWCDLLSHGADFGIQPYGTEALGALRIEKGHVAGGELDGRVSPYNLRLDGMLSKKKWFFGKPLLERDGLYDDDQYRLVGLISEDRQPLQAGAHVVFGDKAGPGPSQGWVSSVTYSPSLDEEIGLALVKKQALEKDTGMYAANPVAGIHRKVRIVSHHFLDPEGHRMRL